MSPHRLALSSLLHDRVRTAVSAIGSMFAVLLIFMQYGFLGALQNTATLLYDRLDFDLILMSKEYVELSRAGVVKRGRLAEARSAEGVATVVPIIVGPGQWRNPTNDPQRGGRRWQISILAVDPARFDEIFLPADTALWATPEEKARAKVQVARVGTVMLDRRSRPDFGTETEMPPGTTVELSGTRLELAGYFDLGTGFSYTGLALTNEATYSQIGREKPDEVSFGLVKLRPGEDVERVAERLRAVMPKEVIVLTRDQLTRHEQRFWVSETAIGTFFNFGVFLALFVGGIFVYQMMVADIKKHLPEYATLKAMGYRFRFLFWIVVWQSVFLAVSGYVGGLLGALVLYDMSRDAAHLPIAMTWERMGVVFALAVGMCVGSGLIAVRKVRSADPADLF